MSRKLFSRILAVSAIIFAATLAHAQDGTFSGFTPYSVYGIGQLHNPGSAYNQSMGGVGIAGRNHRFINYLNPASVTARDSLSFMADFGLSSANTIYRQNLDGNNMKSAHNTFNINDFIISFPIYRSSAFIVGIVPYSNVGYSFSHKVTDPDIIARTGNLGYSASGSGSLYEVFAGGAVTFWNRLSIGAQYMGYFGNLEKKTSLDFASSSYRSINSGYSMQLRASTGKVGIQYEQPLPKNNKLTIGATYKIGARMRGYVTDFAYASLSSITDTLKNSVDTLKYSKAVSLAGELGVGVSFRAGDKWSVDFDFIRYNWTRSGFDSAKGFANSGDGVFSSSVAQSFRAGFEYTPNRSDIRYYLRRCTYRAGLYYDRSYFRYNGMAIDGFGLTVGATFPVFRGYNGITVQMEVGQRGRVSNNLIRERWLGFSVGFNIFDIWFQKPKYE